MLCVRFECLLMAQLGSTTTAGLLPESRRRGDRRRSRCVGIPARRLVLHNPKKIPVFAGNERCCPNPASAPDAANSWRPLANRGSSPSLKGRNGRRRAHVRILLAGLIQDAARVRVRHARCQPGQWVVRQAAGAFGRYLVAVGRALEPLGCGGSADKGCTCRAVHDGSGILFSGLSAPRSLRGAVRGSTDGGLTNCF